MRPSCTLVCFQKSNFAKDLFILENAKLKKIALHFQTMFQGKMETCLKVFKDLSVNEDYDYLWVVHCFDVETIIKTEVQPGSTLTAFCFEIAYSLLRKIVEREFQILTLMNFHEPLEIKCNFQPPSSSDLPLKECEKKNLL